MDFFTNLLTNKKTLKKEKINETVKSIENGIDYLNKEKEISIGCISDAFEILEYDLRDCMSLYKYNGKKCDFERISKQIVQLELNYNVKIPDKMISGIEEITEIKN